MYVTCSSEHTSFKVTIVTRPVMPAQFIAGLSDDSASNMTEMMVSLLASTGSSVKIHGH